MADVSETQVASNPTYGAHGLEAQVQQKLSGRIASFRLVIVDDGVILEGRTQTYYAKQLAQQAVMEVTTVPIIANRIEVVKPNADYFSAQAAAQVAVP